MARRTSAFVSYPRFPHGSLLAPGQRSGTRTERIVDFAPPARAIGRAGRWINKIAMTEYELSDGSLALGITLPIAPYGSALILGEDTTAKSEAVLRELESSWTDLWPEMLKMLQNSMENLEIDAQLVEQRIVGSASRTRYGEFMSDKSDIYVSLRVGESPDWDYFIRGAKIVHFQPVF